LGLDVYFRRDIAHALRSVACASEGAMNAVQLLDGGAHKPTSEADTIRAYREGVAHALMSMGLAFGLEPVIPSKGMSPALASLLWVEVDG